MKTIMRSRGKPVTGPKTPKKQPLPDTLQPIVIENVTPQINDGLFAAKCVVGERFIVEADIFKDGHDKLKAAVQTAPCGTRRWKETPLKHVGQDHWSAEIVFDQNQRYEYRIAAWMDPIATWLDHVEKKAVVDPQMRPEQYEGMDLVTRLAAKLNPKDKAAMMRYAKLFETSRGISGEILRIVRETEFRKLLQKAQLRTLESFSTPVLEVFVDRVRAVFGSWYELFPRSQAKEPNRHGTFKDCIRRLADIKKMGFNVIYLPPIHPIGKVNRKGPNNSLKAGKNDPGSPWAIGSKEGGHKAVHPELGTLKDFRNFVDTAADYGIEIALDLAYQCAPDHPYVKLNPDWFHRLPDGTIRFAENPPKKYQDIYPFNFHCKDREGLWAELRSVVEFWIEQGVKIFRVDNPHTKPLRFWKWLISEIQRENPEVIFLAEAFTRPHVMKFLAKAGFSQSYTYFTWKNAKWDLSEYMEELTSTGMRHYFRPNFFANTPDILHAYLQEGGSAAFRIRLILAATLSASYGIYSGYELCENKAKEPDSEEYLDSEKYQIRHRDWNGEGNIKDLIARVNRIRNDNPALQQQTNFALFGSPNDQVMAYGKWTDDLSNIVIVAVNLNPRHTQEDLLYLPVWKFGIEDWQTFQVRDLLTGNKFYWKGRHHYIRLDPEPFPAHIFVLKK